MAKARKTLQKTTKAGGRTGVVIGNTVPGGEASHDIDEWFDSAHTPSQNSDDDDADGAEDSDDHKWASRSTSRRSPRRKVKTPRGGVAMALPGGGEDDEDDDDEVEQTATKKYAEQLKRKGGPSARPSFTSPSDLSRVSTAPPSPTSREDIEDDDEEEGLAVAAEDESTDDIENPLLTQERDEEPGTVDEEDVAQHSASNRSNEKMDASSHEAEFPAGDDHDDENDGDDLGPPALPDDYSADGKEQEDQPTETSEGEDEATRSQDRIGGLESDHDDNDEPFPDDDDNDDKEGSGFNMVHDPETPRTVREERARKEKEDMKMKRSKKKKEKSESESEDVEGNTEDGKATPKATKGKRIKAKKKRGVIFSPKGIPIGNRDYETVPIGALVEGSPEEDGPRRSNRAKVKPLEYWRGEKMEFGAHREEGQLAEAFGNMPVVTGVQKALPTPYRKRKQTAEKSVGKKKSGKPRLSSAKGAADEEEFDSRKLRRMYKYLDGQEAYLHDEVLDEPLDQKVVAYASEMKHHDLPITKPRKKSESKLTSKACQAFDIKYDDDDIYRPGYIMGNLILAPTAIKDSESVGTFAQTFTVCICQPKSLEVAYGDPDQPGGALDPATAQRFLLSPGDLFRVPPGNSYRLENHSQRTDAVLTWTIIRP